jgi:surfeit locus 1 family protein
MNNVSIRRVIIFLAAVAGMALTARLGVWQLSRAEEKQAYQKALEVQAQLPPLTKQDLMAQPELWQQVHRHIALEGQWMADKTVYLDNRVHQGQPGFWVITPLSWAPGQVVWVQRGWVARDRADATKAAPVDTPKDSIKLMGRVAVALSQMTELKSTIAVEPMPGQLRIQSNLSREQMQAMVSDKVSGLVIQTGEDSDGLKRDWPVISQTADKNKGYAFQWFALSGLIGILYFWFQWIGPLRHARQQQRT